MWRVFSGVWVDGKPEYSYMRDDVEMWCEARILLIREIANHIGSSCASCEDAAVNALCRLAHCKQGDEFWAEIDGTDYLICKMERVEIKDLIAAARV